MGRPAGNRRLTHHAAPRVAEPIRRTYIYKEASVVRMRTSEQSIGGWLAALASGASTPGGGAAAAMLAAQGAALIGMVAELTIGKPAYVEHEDIMRSARDAAEAAREVALLAADADAAAFDAVMAAYGLPKDTDEQKTARSQQIQASTYAAAQPPLEVARIAAEVIELARRIEPGANVNMLSDVAVAAQCARAALDAAAINVEINLAALKDQTKKDQLRQAVNEHLALIHTADAVISDVRERITK